MLRIYMTSVPLHRGPRWLEMPLPALHQQSCNDALFSIVMHQIPLEDVDNYPGMSQSSQLSGLQMGLPGVS